MSDDARSIVKQDRHQRRITRLRKRLATWAEEIANWRETGKKGTRARHVRRGANRGRRRKAVRQRLSKKKMTARMQRVRARRGQNRRTGR